MRRMSGSTILPGKNTRKNPGTSSKRKSKSKTNRKKDSTHLARRRQDRYLQTTSKRTSGRTLRTPEHRRTLEQKRNNTVLQRDWTHADSHKKIARSKTHFQPHRMADDWI